MVEEFMNHLLLRTLFALCTTSLFSQNNTWLRPVQQPDIPGEERRLALVTGNNGYQNVSRPQNTKAEARAIRGQKRAPVLVAIHGVVLELIPIPAGTFQMGTAGNSWNELQHAVTISQAFLMGKFPVTQGQWQALMGNNPSHFKKAGSEAPVENVRWVEAQEFLAKLNDLQVEWTFRLPTEAEWEYACRAGTTGERYGNLNDIAWYSGNSGGTTHPVGQKRPNAFGLYDMQGNVWQWCQDNYEDHPSGSATDPQGPSGDATNHDRVTRGGSWNAEASWVRSAFRGVSGRLDLYPRLGFRVAAIARAQ